MRLLFGPVVGIVYPEQKQEEQKVYQLLKNREMSGSAVAEATGSGKSKAVAILNKLVQQGQIMVVGTGRGTEYKAGKWMSEVMRYVVCQAYGSIGLFDPYSPEDKKLHGSRRCRMKAFDGKVAVITGGAHGIGKAVADAFRREGASVYIIDKQPGEWFVGDVSDKESLELFAEAVAANSSNVDYLINNALPMMKGIDECSWEEFSNALAVGVTAPFYLTKLLMPRFAPGASVINISSSRDRMSQPQTESYTAAKGGIAALTHAMAVSLAGKARVNSISPGWIDTAGNEISGADALQQPVGRVGRPEDIAEMVLFLCSEKAGFITGENICIDGGMTKLMIYHGEHGWEYRE